MNAEQFQPILLLKLSLLLGEFIFLALALYSLVANEEFLVFCLALRKKALVDQLLNVFVNMERGNYLSAFIASHCLDFIDQTFYFDGGIVFYLGTVLVKDENLTKTHSTAIQYFDLLR
jgi:hypothetical protein